MTKRFRFFLILAVLGISAMFLWPTVRWYYFIPQDQKELANESRDAIRLYAEKKGAEEADALLESFNTDPNTPMPAQYGYLIQEAKDAYQQKGVKIPDKWTIKAVIESGRFGITSISQTKNLLQREIEFHYRDKILALKDSKRSILRLGLDLNGGMSVLLEADRKSLEERMGKPPTDQEYDRAIQNVMEILNNRVDKFGLSEPQIRRVENNKISIELPGAADPDRINAFIMGKGRLNFQIVDDEATKKLQEYLAANPDGLDKNGQPKDKNLLQAGLMVVPYYQKDAYGVDKLHSQVVVDRAIQLSGEHIIDANVGRDRYGRPYTTFILDNTGAENFYKLTDANVGKTLAVVVDDKMRMGARINEAISGGRVQVSGLGFSADEAKDWSKTLRTAALPIDLKILGSQTVGATMGANLVQMGLRAIALGFVLVVLFMWIYYKGAGLIADLALVLNLLIIVGILSAFELTLSLTSIAGLILTVGMAVDANVIIFERIKEEYRLGKSPKASLEAGFKKAFWTIMDANITTIIAAVFLSVLSTSLVKGFAYTLVAGVVSSMFTALFVSRFIFDVLVEGLKTKKLSISWRIK